MIFLKFAGLLFVLIAVSAEKVGNKAEKKVEKRDTNALLRSEGYRPVQGQLEFVEAMNEILFPNRSSSMFPFRRKKRSWTRMSFSRSACYRTTTRILKRCRVSFAEIWNIAVP